MGRRRCLIVVISFLFPIISSTAARPQAFTHVWSHGFGGPLDEQSYSIAVDASGNVLVAGSFEGTVDFGGGTLTSAAIYDIFVAKFDSEGNHLWSKSFGDSLYNYPWSVAADAAGNVLMTGHFEGTVDFGGGTLTGAGDWQHSDIFVVKFDPEGNHLWSQNFGDVWLDYGMDIAVDASGNVIVTGGFCGTVDFGGGPLVNENCCDKDIFVVKFAPDGSHIWSHSFGDWFEQSGRSIAVDASGNILVTGEVQSTVDFGEGPFPPLGDWGIFVVKFAPDGSHIWSHGFGDPAEILNYKIAVDPSGNALVTGRFCGTVDFGGEPLTGAGDWMNTDIFVVKFDSEGNHLWSHSFGNSELQSANGIAAHSYGNVLVTGYFQGAVDFGGGPLTSAGEHDIFIAMFSPNGSHLWSAHFGDPYTDLASDIAVDISENVLITGYFSGAVDFGGGPLTSAGECDVYIAKFFGSGVATLLRSFSARRRASGIEIAWELAEAGEGIEFDILREGPDEAGFRELERPDITVDGLSFRLVDHTCRPGTTYRYRVDVSDEDGRRILFETEPVTTPALRLTLAQNHPNPFNPMTTISFTLPGRVFVNLSIYDLEGRPVKTLVNDMMDAGYGEIVWDGTDVHGNPVSSGVYLCRLKAGGPALTKKMVLLR